MTYDIDCYKPVTGTPSVEEAIRVLERGGDVSAVDTKENQLRMKKIADALTKFDSQLEVFVPSGTDLADYLPAGASGKRLDRIELNGPEVQIEIYQDSAALVVPYWYEGAQAKDVFSKISAYLRIICDVAGYFVYDPQLSVAYDPKLGEHSGKDLYEREVKALPGIVAKIVQTDEFERMHQEAERKRKSLQNVREEVNDALSSLERLGRDADEPAA